jgi:two-component system OmpR family response regulator
MRVRKVLLVDDDADLRRLGQMSLSKLAGWEVVVASSGEQALSLARSELPDVALLDVSMPGMDGRTVLRTLRAEPATAPIPVVFITARALPDEIASLIAAGAAGVITKPFDVMKLPDQILAVLAGPATASLPSPSAGLAPGLAESLLLQRDSYRANLPGRVEALVAAVARARAEGTQVRIVEARTLAHKLSGSAGSHGLLPVSEAAARIEEALRALPEGGDTPRGWREVEDALTALRSALA